MKLSIEDNKTKMQYQVARLRAKDGYTYVISAKADESDEMVMQNAYDFYGVRFDHVMHRTNIG